MAVRGAKPGYDGHAFVLEALDGARRAWWWNALCPARAGSRWWFPDAMAAHGRICQALAGDPSYHLLTVGVSGTFGRTLTALMVRSIFEAAGQRTGLPAALGFFDAGRPPEPSEPAWIPRAPAAGPGMGGAAVAGRSAGSQSAWQSPGAHHRTRPAWRP